jgi:hypothetical protein
MQMKWAKKCDRTNIENMFEEAMVRLIAESDAFKMIKIKPKFISKFQAIKDKQEDEMNFAESVKRTKSQVKMKEIEQVKSIRL